MASSSASTSASRTLAAALPVAEETTLTRSVPARSEPSLSIDPSSSAAHASPEPVESHASLHGLAGRSPVMRRLILQMRRMAPHLSVATIEGHVGTGRTMAARALHAAGPAAERAFVPCLATQFFSHSSTSDGERASTLWPELVLRQAHGGMLFLDRVDQLSAAQQESLADFLHWFDDRHFRARQLPLGLTGGTHPAPVEVALPAQVVFSCSAPLRDAGASNFREDLASRLCAVRFRLPPLTERREDIPLLAQIFIQRFARAYGKAVRGLGPGTIAPLLRHSWPGNVRELEETITRRRPRYREPVDSADRSSASGQPFPGCGQELRNSRSRRRLRFQPRPRHPQPRRPCAHPHPREQAARRPSAWHQPFDSLPHPRRRTLRSAQNAHGINIPDGNQRERNQA